MIHFVPPHQEKLRAKVPEMAREVDVILANLEDAIPADAKEAARAGADRDGQELRSSKAGVGFLGARQRAQFAVAFGRRDRRSSPSCGDKLDVIMVPKVEGPWDIHYMRSAARAAGSQARRKKPILLHAMLETAQGVTNVEAIAGAQPAHAGHCRSAPPISPRRAK